MKKTFFSVLVSILTMSTAVNAETILLSFSGATTEGRYCLLDSVKIENLTQNWAQTLDCSVDTTFDLPITQIPTGIDNVAASEDGSNLLYVHQNFSVGNTVVSINPIHDGIVRMRVIDMMGRVIIEHAEYLTAGTHQYILQLGSPQTYMLSVVTDSESASAKILNMTASGWYELSRITSFLSANLIPSRRIAHANEGDLMRYTGYTNQQGSVVPSEQIIQYQSEPEHIVLQFSPVAKSQAGVYTGMMGFNSQLYTYAFDMLTTSNLTKHKNFVSNLSMASGTILYHAVYTSLYNMIHAPVPEKLENVSIVTFTDGEDQGSRRMSDKFPTNALYLEACSRLINRTYIDGTKLDAYTIGVKGSDVQDEDAFENNLHQLASDSSNVFYVSNMDEVNTRFRDIAAKIYSTKVSYSLTIKLPAQEPGTLIRFTFDDVTDARNSIYYIEGEYEDYSGHQGSLNNVTYSGLKCDNGSTWISSPDGIFDIFTINNFSTCLGEKVSTNNMKQWRYIPSADRWQVNSEFDVSTNTSTTEERTSAIVALVLDCSSSLGSEFTNLKNAAKTFLDILAGKGTITPPSISNASYELGDEQATLHASITNAGSLSITDKGFCVSEYPNMDDAVFYSCGAGTDNFEYLLTNLVDGQTYYIRPYATTLSGKKIGNCTSFSAIAATPPSVNTFDANDITVHSTQLSGEVISANYSNVIERGICWSIAPNPTIDDNKIELGSGLGKFETLIINLDDGTTYYVRAYAINEKGVGYGEEKSFTTIAIVMPIVVTFDITNISTGSAFCGGHVTFDGNADVIDRGICWSTNPNPTIADNVLSLGSGDGSFSETVSGLDDGTTYYVRAYAINSKGVGYGEEKSFTTIAIVPPTVTTSDVTNITTFSAQCGGDVTNDGNSNVIERGICWSKRPNPTIEDSVIIVGSGLGSYTTTIIDLEDGNTYYVRAYAKNSKEVGYGEEKSFTTIAIVPPTVTTSDVTNITTSSAQCGGSITNNGNSDIIEFGLCWSINPNPTIDDTTIVLTSGMATFTSLIDGLEDGTTYYVRAYAKNSKEIGYGEEKSFTTVAIVPPTVTTSDVTNITINSAQCGGDVTNDGNSNVIERGICWSKTPNPTIQDSVIIDGPDLGSFSTIITDLEDGNTYYVRAYAKNSKEVGYGEEKSFSTIAIVPPVVTLSSVNITSANSANCRGEVIFDGNAPITERGFCWSKNPNPTIEDNVILGDKDFLGKITNLKTWTTYYVRAFAKNSKEIGYSEELSSPNITFYNMIKYTAKSKLAQTPQSDYSGSAIHINAFNTSIKSHSFSNGTGIILFYEDLTSIGEKAFYRCSEITSLEMPNSVTSIGENAFTWCSGLTSVTIPDSVTSIGGGAFAVCTGLSSVTIPNSVTSIGDGAFQSCSSLTAVTIPNSVTSIGGRAFFDCTGLTSIEIPNSVTSIGGYAFSGCTGLISVNIGNGTTSIGELAFYDCTGLNSITCKAITPPSINSNVFYNVSTSIPVYVPAASVSAYKSATGWSDFTNIQAIVE